MSSIFSSNKEALLENLNWHALRRECALVRDLIGSGVTALGRANYANGLGEYYNAFFGLSIGIERLTKLIVIADYIIRNDGKMPDEKLIRDFGHDLIRLVDHASKVQSAHDIKLHYRKPTSEITNQILICLDAFADAKRGRYANFAPLGNPNITQDFEPIRIWWTEVASRILKEHYYGKLAQRRVEANAAVIDSLIGEVTLVRHINESGQFMNDVYSASRRTGESALVQKFGRYYSLSIVRYLSEIFKEMSYKGGYEMKLNVIFGLYEYFNCYVVDDYYLKNRKIWPI